MYTKTKLLLDPLVPENWMCLSSQQFCVILLSSMLCSCPFTKKLIQELGCASISTELYYLQDLSSYQKVTSYANHI